MSELLIDRIMRDFTYRPAPNPNVKEQYGELWDRAREFAEFIHYRAPEGREQSLALTNLEQAVMWTIAAIARAE